MWAPAFLAGAAAATAGELSAGLLLYSGLGFLRALTVVLTVQMGAFAVGLWTAWSPNERPGVDHARRRWLLALIAFTAAAAFAGVSRILGGQPSSGAAQGLGLALLGGLPMFTAGALLGSLGRLSEPGSARALSVGAGAASGAAVGFLLTGFFFVPRLEPSSTLLICVIALSAGALLHGWVLDQREVTERLETRWTARGLVAVEDRARGVPPTRRRVLLEANRLRGAEYVQGDGGPGWEQAVVATVARGRPRADSILLYGTGAGTLARRLHAELEGAAPSPPASTSQGEPETAGEAGPPRRPILVGIEPNPEVRRLAMAHFPPGRDDRTDPWAGVEVREGVALHAVGRVGTFDLVVVDATALGPSNGMPPVSPSELAPFLDCIAPGGVLVLGGLEAPAEGGTEGLDAWMAAADELAPERIALVTGAEMFLVLSTAVDGSHWTGGPTTELARWDSSEHPPSP